MQRDEKDPLETFNERPGVAKTAGAEKMSGKKARQIEVYII